MEKKAREFYWYWFVNIPGIGRVSQKKLLERFGHPKDMFYAEEKDYGDILGKRKCVYFEKSRNTHSINLSMEKLKKSKTRFIHWESKEYPEKFRNLFDPPYGFYLRGTLPKETFPVLGMVGSRKATPYGIQMATYFARTFAEMGIQIVSGLAAGIDAASHRGALQKNGYTLGILGGGIDTIYPRENYNLYMKMYQTGGVLSEYNLGIANQPGLFPVRNRLISGISDGVFVLEAGKKSGSFITADQALEQGKDVFSLPGRITDTLSEGCNHLIAEGAYLVQKPEDVYEILMEKKIWNKRDCLLQDQDKKKNKESCKEPVFQSDEQRTVYYLLDAKRPRSFNEILEKTGYSFVKLQHILLEMEISQWIYQSSQNQYLRKF